MGEFQKKMRKKIKSFFHTLFMLISQSLLLLLINILIGVAVCVDNKGVLVGIIWGIACYIVLVVGIVIFSMAAGGKEMQQMKDMIDEFGITPQLCREMEKQARVVNVPSARLDKMMRVATFYSFLGDFDSVFRCMYAVKLSEVYPTQKSLEKGNFIQLAVYYNDLVFYYLECDDTENAEKAYRDGHHYMEKMMSKFAAGAAPCAHTFALREYHLGNYAEAEKILKLCIKHYEKEVPSESVPNTSLMYCKRDLGRVYLKTGRYFDGNILLNEARELAVTDYQRQTIDRMIKERYNGEEIEAV